MARTCIPAILGTLLLPSVIIADAEHVTLRSVMKDKLVVVRKDGSAYLAEKGMGCLSVSQYQGRQVVIDSPGRFLGVGSRLLLPNAEQDCQIWQARACESKNDEALTADGSTAPGTSWRRPPPRSGNPCSNQPCA